MERVKLTGTNLAALESDFASSGKTDQIYWDTEIKGFGLRFRSGGHRWILQYKFHGADRRYILGPYPGITAKVARELAHDKLADVWKGIDPQAAKQEAKVAIKIKAAPKLTLRTVIDRFLAAKESTLRPQSLYEARRYLLVTWQDLHKYPIEDIQIPHVANILDTLKKAVTAARARSNLSTLFRWAMGHGYVKHNPVVGTINPDPKTTRDRVLSDRELAAVWNACQDDDYGRIVKLLVLTGQRRSEVGGMTWRPEELNFDDGTWTIPASRTKNKKAHTLSLPPACWSIIEGVKRRPDIDHLFGRGGDRGFRNWDLTKKALDQRCQLPPWTHHDLRRTVATRMAERDIAPVNIIEALLNHVSGHKSGVAGIYNRATYQRQVKTALAMWADYLHANIAGSERKIIPMLAKAEES
jgi:integrase